MAASVDAAAAALAPPAAAAEEAGDAVERARTLVAALNLLSRNLPLPPAVLRAVSSIYHDGGAGGEEEEEEEEEEAEKEEGEEMAVPDGGGERDAAADGAAEGATLIEELEDAIFKNQRTPISYSELAALKEGRFNASIQHRLAELEGLPSTRGEDMQMKCLLELYGLKLLDLQKKVRSDISAEYWLHKKCAYPERQLFDWGMMRIRYPFTMYGIGDSFLMDADDVHRKKRFTERISRLEEEEKNQADMRKRKFFTEILNAYREHQVQLGTTHKQRKQRNDGVLAWHVRARQRISRLEKTRLVALKNGDQEAYMRMVEESKNERLKMLLDKTNELLEGIGKAVQRQKDAEHVNQPEGFEVPKGSESEDGSQISGIKSESPGESPSDDDADPPGSANESKFNAGRRLDSTVHSIEEKVTEQPSALEGGELRPYQLEGLQWMLSLFNNNLNGILADEMGLGKTIQTIALIAYLLEKKEVAGPHLIIAPKAVLPNWANEFKTWAPSIGTILYDGRPDERKTLREANFEGVQFNVLLTHYDLILKDKKFLKKVHWHYLIVDEGHRLKNHECALARTLVSGYQIRRRLLLTGTPIQNSLQELWSLLNFILPNIFNSSQNFEEWFNAPFACDVSLNDEEQLLIIHRLHQVLRPFLLRRKKDEVEKYLPVKTQVILKCDLSAWQKAYYEQVTSRERVSLGSGLKSKALQNLSMQLRKCCNHPYLFVEHYNMYQREEIVRASGKFELLDRLLPKLQRAGHRVLLFSQMTKLLDILEVYLQMYNFKYMRLDGSTKTEERGRLLADFNKKDSEYFLFLLSTRAGGLGLNLQTADTVIIFDSDWNPQMDQQAEDRAHRIGQKNEVRVFVLVSVGSIEEEILDRAKQKMGIDAKVIQAGLFNTTSTAQDRRAMLQEILRRGTSSLGTDIPSEREINRLAARNDGEFWLFEKMDEERRQRENYKSRLMDGNEVPDWVFANNNETLTKKTVAEEFQNIMVGTKRRRKEVVYSDSFGDQWMKSEDGFEDIPKMTPRAKRTAYSSDIQGDYFSERRKRPRSLENSADGANNPMWTPEKGRAGVSSYSKDENEDDGDEVITSGLQGSSFTWKTLGRKRSNHFNSSSDSKGRPSF
ncbi:probable ATP-dependent DNA helicase CHR719 isoform X2 [Phragmites australis]|uniref:probable ATP-dependent DNA helicase CHR719 isoform X2 n=1 Tax=Phragmites australis TaxID=29695 RepID=UPI002D796A75|nr:probable ATP-dependent DNA helicase CHR719 isoform X2 [Phragmites australis]